MESINHAVVRHVPWNEGEIVGQKAPLKQPEICSCKTGHCTADCLISRATATPARTARLLAQGAGAVNRPRWMLQGCQIHGVLRRPLPLIGSAAE